jgi:release factor glutamine methyltransferase
MQLKTALVQASKLLEQAAIPSPRLTAEVLLCHVLGRDRSWLFGHSDEPLSETAWIHYGRYLYQRLNGKPLQHITRRQEFYGRPFLITPDVLIPRPETEHVIEVALRRARQATRAVDIGCGSGAIAITWALETGAEVIATDLSLPALSVARENACLLQAQVRFLACNLASSLSPASFDLVLSNPPYIPDTERECLQREVRDHEPPLALYGGPTGVEIYEPLIADAARLLRPGGWLILEIGYRAQDRVRALLDTRFTDIEVDHDLAGWPRVLSARYSP